MSSHTHEPTEVSRRGALSLLQNPLHYRGGSAKFVPSPCVVALGQVAPRNRVLVHEVDRVEELVERRRARSADHAGVEVEALDMGMGGCAREIFVLVTCRNRR
jgi:hypothetical protein